MDRSAPTWQVERVGETVRLAGMLPTSDGTHIVQAFRRASGDTRHIELDLADVQRIDSGVVMLLLEEVNTREGRLTLLHGDRFRPLFDLCAEGCAWLRNRTRPAGLVEQVGARTLHRVAEVNHALEFTGEMTLAAGRLSRHPGLAHWGEIPELIERAGMDALPIVLVLNFLIGFVTAYMSAHVLSTLGANIYVADLVSIATTRQLGPLVTAIIVCGRSGAAFTAELGSMKVSQEIDALRTLGLEPFGWLVLPRVLTLVLVTPVLALLADVVAMLGGLVVAVTSLGLTTKVYFNETRTALEAWDVESGLWMALAYAIAIGFIACQQGLAASHGAVGVGQRTTQTVVHSLFAIIFLDAVLTVAYRAFGLS